MAADEQVAGIFASVHFQFIISDALPLSTYEQLAPELIAHGGHCHAAPATALTAALDGLTHIITETIDFDGYAQADDRMLGVVNSSWITTSVAKKRLANPKSHSPDPRLFFSGLVFCAADLPEGDKDAIIGGVSAMGGLYSSAISKLVTHVVARDMQPAVCQTVLAKNFQCQIVRPEWFDDCLRLGKRINELPYRLPEPGILTVPESMQPAQCPDLKDAISPHAAHLQTPPPEISTGLECDPFLGSKKIMLGGDLGINEHLRDSIIAASKRAGASFCDETVDCDVYIGYYRSGSRFEEAFNAGKTIGNLAWLYWMISRGRWTDPQRRLLHYPIPKEGLTGTEHLRLCLSNYSGEARIYLENLARAAGCDFTKTLKHENTHLITAHTQSEKCEAAREWGIKLVNHLWLEESYAHCQIQTANNPRYTFFPPSTNLTEVVGHTPIDRKALAAQIRKEHPEPSSSNNGRTSLANTAIIPSSPTKPLAQRGRINQVAQSRNETPSNQKSDGKENEILPLLTSGRSAKSKATERLLDLSEDILRYEKEKKRVGGVVYGGRRKNDPNRTERKRSTSDADLSEGEIDTPSKKSRLTTMPPRMRILVTGVPAYSKSDKPSIRKRDQLRELGILITESENNCNYLIAPRILRTRKFLCAIAQAPTILSPAYLDECLRANELLNPADFVLSDNEGEGRYGVTFEEMRVRAVGNRSKMLRGWTIWVTACIANGCDPYIAITEANGGRCLPFQGRPGTIPQMAHGSDQEEETKSVPAYLISGNSSSEQAIWAKFRRMATDAGREPRIVASEWLLDAALKQDVQWDPTYELNDQTQEDGDDTA